MPSPASEIDLKHIRRAISLAIQGRGAVEPNPMVGCVIVKDGRIIGEGYHQRYGGPHAEPNALAACTESPAGATAYVTLEPCCHTDKQTPPCVPKLIESRLARVVVGTQDPNPQVSGKGIAQLLAAGIDVQDLELPQARQLIAPFIARVIHGRAYVTLKWAESANRKVAGAMGCRIQISNPASTRIIHELRARCDAILIGINTALCDDPLLTVRRAEPKRPLMRVVLDRSLRIPLQCRLVKTPGEAKVIVYTTQAAMAANAGKCTILASAGVELRTSTQDPSGRLDLRQVIADLGTLGITHLLVEPGPTLARSFLAGEQPLWDRFWVIRSPMRIDHPTAPDAAPLPEGEIASTGLDDDVLTEYLNPRSNVMFSPDPSADFLLARAVPSPG
jgi:diaminohydroxyphosphoribosylaminopyrimidine deaminase / 5-amino-6-(5-phosphoribosylamino)uracil reductase